MGTRNIRMTKAALVLLLALLAGSQEPAQAEEKGWGFGTDLGFISGTTNDTVFALNFQADYYVAKEFSIGPMLFCRPRTTQKAKKRTKHDDTARCCRHPATARAGRVNPAAAGAQGGRRGPECADPLNAARRRRLWRNPRSR